LLGCADFDLNCKYSSVLRAFASAPVSYSPPVRRVHRIGFTSLAIVLGFEVGSLRADVVAVVSARSAVTALSKDDVLDIFLGKRTHFPDGSKALPIDQSEGTPARD